MRTRMVLAKTLLLGLVVLPVPAAAALQQGESHDLTVELVSFDTKMRTVTFKDESGEQNTAHVLKSAMNELATMKPGEQITLTCADNEDGEHLGVSKVKRARAKKSTS